MKKVILAAVLAGASSTAALAADMGAPRTYTKAPAMPDRVYGWTGFYVGGDIGGGSPSAITSTFTESDNPPTVQGDRAGSTLMGGVHAGYNWQFTPNLVAGVEGDWQSVRSKNSFCRQTDAD